MALARTLPFLIGFDRLRDLPLGRIGVAVERFRTFESPSPQRHGHRFLEMAFIVAGTCIHEIGSDSFVAGPGSLGIVHYGQTHAYRTDGAPVDIVNIYLDPQRHPIPELPDPLARVLPEILPLHENLAHRCNQVLHIRFDDPAPLTRLFEAMLDEQRERRDGWLDALFSLYRLVLMRCARAVIDGDGVVQGGKLHPRIARIEGLRRELDRRFAHAWTLDELAAEAGCTPSSFSRAFKRHTGRGPVEYLRLRRVQHAMLLLRQGGAAIAAIGADCGFDDQARFSRAFRQVAGCTPSAYRRRFAARG